MDRAAIFRLVERHADDIAIWRQAILALVELGDPVGVDEVLRVRRAAVGDAASLLWSLLSDLRRLGDKADWLFSQTAIDPAFRGVLAFGAGLEAGARYDLDRAVRLIRAGARHTTQAVQRLFPGDQALWQIVPRMLRDANLLEPAGFDAGDGVAPLPAIETIGAPAAPASGALLVAACDWRYFELYHGRFLAALETHCPDLDYLLHVINPPAGTDAVLTALMRDHPRLRITRERGPAYKVYYASCRFLIAERIMDRFGCDVVTVDVDGVFDARFSRVLGRVRDQDVAFLRLPGELMLVPLIDAAFLFVRNGDAGRRFLRRCGGYLVRKLAVDPVWMVDQAALYRAVCLTGGQPGRITDLNTLLDAPFDLRASLKDDRLIGDAELIAGRAPLGLCPVRFDPADKPTFQVGFSIWDPPPAAG